MNAKDFFDKFVNTLPWYALRYEIDNFNLNLEDEESIRLFFEKEHRGCSVAEKVEIVGVYKSLDEENQKQALSLLKEYGPASWGH